MIDNSMCLNYDLLKGGKKNQMGYSRSDIENGKILAYWKKATYRCKCGNEITKKFLVPAPCWNCMKDIFNKEEIYTIKNCPKCSKKNKPSPLPPPRCPHCKEKIFEEETIQENN